MTWKARTKVKRQWLVNKKIHVDTVKLVPDEADIAEDEYDDND
jgi:hypothetical protein